MYANLLGNSVTSAHEDQGFLRVKKMVQLLILAFFKHIAVGEADMQK